MGKALRVLNVTIVFKAAGIESFIMNMYRHMDREKVQFDFLVMRDEKEYYDDEIAQLGGKKYTTSQQSGSTLLRVIKESIALYRFLKEHPYDIVHIHYTTPLRGFYLLAAKRAGVKVRIYHSHSAAVSGKSIGKRIVYAHLRHCIKRWATDYFACSKAAAEWMFPKEVLEKGKAKIIFNGIDVDRFRFSETARAEIRKEYGLNDSFVLIHTGRFLDQKNHAFIIDLFHALKKRCPTAKLMLLGTGELFDEIREKVRKLGLDDDVFFLGVHSDVERYLSAADCYIMPSLYEGLPVAAVEAECSGLPCVFSTNITREVALTDRTAFLALDAPIEQWCDVIQNGKAEHREICVNQIAEHGYDVQNVANRLQEFYESVVKR